MFSPSSGSLKSVTSVVSDAGADTGDADAAADGAFCAGDVVGDTEGEVAAVGFAGEGPVRLRSGLVRAAPPAPFSTVKITWPTLIFSPSLTRTSLIVPLTDDGTSITALSVSSSITAWPSVTLAPGEIISRTRSPWSMFSPSSGSLNSVTYPFLP